MRTATALVTILLLAAQAHGTQVRQVFTNDIGYRWEFGEAFDVTKPANEQTGNSDDERLPVKEAIFRPDSLQGGAYRLDLIGVAISPVQRGGAGFFGGAWASRRPGLQRFPAPRRHIDGGFLWATTDRWGPIERLSEIDPFYTFVLTPEGFDPVRVTEAGFIQLAKVGEVIVDGIAYADYQPISWGWGVVPEPSSLLLMLLGAIPLCGRFR